MNKAGWIVLVLAAGALAALYLWVRPQPAPAAPAVPAGTAAAPAAAPVGNREFEFDIAQGKVRGPPALVANVGERVTLRVRSDVVDELHVHGYELSAPLPAGEWVALNFVAGNAGRFDVELHATHRELGALEVRPQ